MDNSRLMTYGDLSQYLSRSLSALRSDVMKKRIPFLKIGDGKHAQVRFRKSDIDCWLEGLLIPEQKKGEV